MEEIFLEVEEGAHGHSRKMLEETWHAVNKWVLEKMRERCGVHLSSFAKLRWVRVGPKRGRPLFALTAACRRAHNIPHLGEAPEEEEDDEDDEIAEMNFSVIALRYSKFLTKDTAFSCYRDISRTLGEWIATRPVRIEMSVGTLIRDIHGTISFEFDKVALRPKWSSCIDYGDDALGQAFERCVGDVERIAEQTEYEERESRRIAAIQESKQWQRIEKQKNARRELQAFLRKQMIEQKAARRRPKTPPSLQMLRGHAVDGDESPRHQNRQALFVLREREKQLSNDLVSQMESKASRERLARQEMLEEEMRFVRQVRDEMERSRRCEMERKRTMNEDVARAWRASAHLKNLRKLATKGHAKLREYVSSGSVGFDPRRDHRQGDARSSLARDIAKSCIED